MVDHEYSPVRETQTMMCHLITAPIVLSTTMRIHRFVQRKVCCRCDGSRGRVLSSEFLTLIFGYYCLTFSVREARTTRLVKRDFEVLYNFELLKKKDRSVDWRLCRYDWAYHEGISSRLKRP